MEEKLQQSLGILSLLRLPVCFIGDLEQLYLALGNQDRWGILLVYHLPCFLEVSLPELTEMVSEEALKTPRLLVLEDFNIHLF